MLWVVGGFGAFLLGAVWGVASIATGRAGRKSALPFGPFMVVAAIGAMAWGSAVARGTPICSSDDLGLNKSAIADATGGLGSTEVTVAKSSGAGGRILDRSSRNCVRSRSGR